MDIYTVYVCVSEVSVFVSLKYALKSMGNSALAENIIFGHGRGGGWVGGRKW